MRSIETSWRHGNVVEFITDGLSFLSGLKIKSSQTELPFYFSSSRVCNPLTRRKASALHPRPLEFRMEVWKQALSPLSRSPPLISRTNRLEPINRFNFSFSFFFFVFVQKTIVEFSFFFFFFLSSASITLTIRATKFRTERFIFFFYFRSTKKVHWHQSGCLLRFSSRIINV